MNSSQNSASQRSNIFASLRSRGKFQSPTKLQDLGTTKISEATPNQYTTLIPMVADHQKIGRRALKHLCKKDILGSPTKDSFKAAKEVTRQIGAEIVAKGLTHSNLRTACTMAVKPTTALKIAPSSLSQKEKWSKITQSLHNNPHPEKSTTPCNGLLTTNNILHPILRFFHRNPTRTTKPNLWHTTNPTITPQPITHNLCQLLK
jgi:hypothetical protein